MVGTRIAAWGVSGIVMAVADGFGFLGTPVEVPLWALLLMAFMPLGELVDLVRHRVDGLEPRDDPDGGQ